jgi:chromosome segregation ATPase
MAAEKSADMAAFNALRDQWEQTGFVPRKNLHAIQQRYASAVQAFLQNTQGLSDNDRERMQLSAELNLSRQNNPAAMKNVQKKEQQLRKRITQLENDIAVWRNNLEFFANSKGANQLRTEYQSKIKSAEDEITSLKKQVQLFYEA